MTQRIKKVKWVNDADVNCCLSCDTAFSMMLRRHHCRQCGFIFCNQCTRERVVLDRRFGYQNTPVRRCTLCRVLEREVARIVFEEGIARIQLTNECCSLSRDETLTHLSVMLHNAKRHSIPPTTLLTSSSSSSSSACSVAPNAISPRSAPTTPPATRPRPISGNLAPSWASPRSDDNLAAGSHASVASQLSQATNDITVGGSQSLLDDVVLVQCVRLFCSITESLVKDRRVGIRFLNNVLDKNEARRAFESKVVSIGFGTLFPVLVRTGLLELIQDQYYKVSMFIKGQFFEAAGKAAMEKISYFAVGTVLLMSEDGEEGVVVSNATSEATVLLPDGTEKGVGVEQSCVGSPFDMLCPSLSRFCKGTALDLQCGQIALGEVSGDFLRSVLAVMTHLEYCALSERTDKGATFRSFTGLAVVKYLTTFCQISTQEAIQIGEYLVMTCFLEMLGDHTDEPFEGTETQFYKLKANAIKRIHENLSVRVCSFCMISEAEKNSLTIGSPVLVCAGVSSLRGNEVVVVDILEGKQYVRVCLNDISWVLGMADICVSPVTSVLALNFDEEYDENCLQNNATLRRFALMVLENVPLKDQRINFKMHRNVFSGTDAISYISKTFPSVTRSDCIILCENLMKIGVFEQISDTETIGVSFNEKHHFKFNEQHTRGMKQHVPEQFRIKGIEASRTLRRALDRGTIRHVDDADAGSPGFYRPQTRHSSLAPSQSHGPSEQQSHSYSSPNPLFKSSLSPSQYGSERERRSRSKSRPASMRLNNYSFGTSEGGRPSSIYSTPAQSFSGDVFESILLRQGDNGEWYLHVFVLNAEGELERHAPWVQLIANTALRPEPEENSFDMMVWWSKIPQR